MKQRNLVIMGAFCIAVLLPLLGPDALAEQALFAELPLWESEPTHVLKANDLEEAVRSPAAKPSAPSGSNRVFSHVSKPTYTIHQPAKPNGVGLVICPGGGYSDVWLDREGHDLALWLKEFGVTSLVLKYRTNSGKGDGRAYSWKEYLPAVEADARQAIRTLRNQAKELELKSNKIGICGFSAGGNLALLATLHSEPKGTATTTSGMPAFAGLFYPWFREDYSHWIKSRMAPLSATQRICPIFIMNAADDTVTPANKCLDFYSQLLKAGVRSELHIYSKGSHGFDLGVGKGASAATWPSSFVAWLEDEKLIEK